MKRVLIVRLDAIGDYILWRNCLRFLRNCARYREAHLTILGNPAWRDLAEAFDRDCADEWIWVEDRNTLFRKPMENLLPRSIWHRRVEREQAKLKATLAVRGFDEVISPCAFQDALLDELVVGIAPETVGVAAGGKGARSGFTRLVDSGEEAFAFSRNVAVVSALAGEACDARLELDIDGVSPTTSRRVLFFTGASHWTRRWPARRWRELEKLLPPGFETVYAPQGMSLAAFAAFVKSCAAVVSNDTMAVHLAATLGVPAVAVVNGVSGKDGFWPYPPEIGKRVATACPRASPLASALARAGLPGRQLAQYLMLSSISANYVASKLNAILDHAKL